MPPEPAIVKRYELSFLIEENNLEDALARAGRLWSLTEASVDTRTRLMIHTTHWDVLRMLAIHYPPERRGFSVFGRNANSTAGELLAIEEEYAGKLPNINFSGEAPEPLLSEGLSRVLADFLAMAPDPRRRTSVSLMVADAKCRGSAEILDWGFTLMDWKSFGRKVRFRLTALAGFPEETTDAAANAALEAVLWPVGMVYTLGKVHYSRGPEAVRWPHEAAASMAFDHAMESIARELCASGFDWRTLKGAVPDGQAMYNRMEARSRPPPGKFRGETVINAFMRKSFPALKRNKDLVFDGYAYAEGAGGDWSLGIVFDTHPGSRIGKIFKLRCGVFSTDEAHGGYHRTAPMLLCSGGGYWPHNDSCPEFTYETQAELEEILESFREFAADFMRRFRVAFAGIFLPALGNLASAMPVNGSLSCREALGMASRELEVRGFGALPFASCGLVGSVSSLHYRMDPTAAQPADGRLNAHHSWSFSFNGSEGRVAVDVPYAGAIRVGSARPPRGIFLTVIDPLPANGWLDSCEVAGVFWLAFDSLAARYAEFSGLFGSLRLAMAHGRPLWIARFEFSSLVRNEGWIMVTHAVDALSGETFSTHFDERIMNREIQRVEFTEGGPKVV